MNKVSYSVEEIIDGIRNKKNDILTFIYEEFYLNIKNYITTNCGDEEDARDIFQEALIVIYKRVNQNVLILNCSFLTYLFSVCRLLWLKELKLRRINIEEQTGDVGYVELGEDIHGISIENDRYNLYMYHFERLNPDCQKILNMFLLKVPLKEVADYLGFKSEKYAKKRKYKCKEILISMIQEDKRYSKLIK
jgi:RNA polymerase sigma factor (sigma-70 family)